ncbi:MAG: hypothetical protein ACRD3K_06325 [Edaphobacter sp.]
MPTTAPIAPAMSPPSSELRAAPRTAPEKAPVTTRAMNCGGTVRLVGCQRVR